MVPPGWCLTAGTCMYLLEPGPVQPGSVRGQHQVIMCTVTRSRKYHASLSGCLQGFGAAWLCPLSSFLSVNKLRHNLYCMDEADDFLLPVLNLEQELIESGRRIGYSDGLAAGVLEGRELGVQKGYEIGMEVGFYTGCVQMWRRLHAQDSTIIPDRAHRGLVALEELLMAFPLDNPLDPKLQDMLEKVQGRFKAVASMMGCLQDYFPRRRTSRGHRAPLVPPL